MCEHTISGHRCQACCALPPGYVLTNETGKGYGFIACGPRRYDGYVTEDAAVLAAIEHHCGALGLLKPKLQPAVLFHVTERRRSDSNVPAWIKRGFTVDLSLALRYQDADRDRTSITVTRGFVDEHGCVYSRFRVLLPSLPLRCSCD